MAIEYGRRQRRVNMLDTVDERSHKLARSRTALVRIGQVLTVKPGNDYSVSVGGGTVEAGSLMGRYDFAGKLTANVTNPNGVIPMTATINRGGFSVVTGGVRVPVAGNYLVNFSVVCAHSVAASCQVFLRKNYPTGIRLAVSGGVVGANANSGFDACYFGQLDAGDVVGPVVIFPGTIFGGNSFGDPADVLTALSINTMSPREAYAPGDVVALVTDTDAWWILGVV